MKTQHYSRRQFTTHFIGGAIAMGFSPTLLAQKPTLSKDEIDWYDVKEMGVEGKGWTDTKRYFDRFPSKAEGMVRDEVWNLSRHSAGMCMRFVSDSPNIHVRYRLFLDRLSMPHMPATGVSGLDLYANDGNGIDRSAGVVLPDKKEMETIIAKNLSPGSRRYTIYLPLYNGVESLEVGVPKGESFEPLAPRKEKPILFYGTSIMHGACASRPGMAFPAILGRRLRRPTLNLGFSGNGRMEIEVATLLAEQDPCAYVIDCLPNMNETTVSERTIPLVKKIRATHDKTPILLVEDRSFTNSEFFPEMKSHHQKSRAALKKAYAELTDAGVGNLYYLDGDHLLGEDGEGATDGSHPSDLGMLRYADAYEPVLRAILKQF
ncbi:MAG: SGNH/GDSL hydrolase family protein [Flavobacteriaceae bacterium]|nr:SGNH/GDSL hydrolase family protein [Flavobacteriaceae bacterium]